ncbi:hypothetical protein BLNAU_19170 [Blattamonas nauphoetae]|uniref:Uncharacterized protein n=1 Tax=Blattamonas nauphoetae TaxID=2049346 RepID=A0ABQ9X276_9EUKA|nr:hypothetical protein BLNAU_19170 [Blattamonas nauphoetae]
MPPVPSDHFSSSLAPVRQRSHSSHKQSQHIPNNKSYIPPEFNRASTDKNSLLSRLQSSRLPPLPDNNSTRDISPHSNVSPPLKHRKQLQTTTDPSSQPNVSISVVFRNLESITQKQKDPRSQRDQVTKKQTLSDLPHPSLAPTKRSGSEKAEITRNYPQTQAKAGRLALIDAESSKLKIQSNPNHKLIEPHFQPDNPNPDDIPTFLGSEALEIAIAESTVSPIFDTYSIRPPTAEEEAETREMHAASDLLWQSILSSSVQRTPSTREDTSLLERWLDYEILRLKNEKLSKNDYYANLQRVIGRAFNELIRQLTVSCSEHGQFLAYLWMLYNLIFEDICSVVIQNRNEIVASTRQECADSLDQIQKQYNKERLDMQLSQHEVQTTLREQNRGLTDKLRDVQNVLSQREKDLYDARTQKQALEEDITKLQGVLANSMKAIERMDVQSRLEPNNSDSDSEHQTPSRLRSKHTSSQRMLRHRSSTRFDALDNDTGLEGIGNLVDSIGLANIDGELSDDDLVFDTLKIKGALPSSSSTRRLPSNSVGSMSGLVPIDEEDVKDVTRANVHVAYRHDCQWVIEEKEVDGVMMKIHKYFFPGQFVDLDEFSANYLRPAALPQSATKTTREHVNVEQPEPLVDDTTQNNEKIEGSAEAEQGSLSQPSLTERSGQNVSSSGSNGVFNVNISLAQLPIATPQLVVEEKDAEVQCDLGVTIGTGARTENLHPSSATQLPIQKAVLESNPSTNIKLVEKELALTKKELNSTKEEMTQAHLDGTMQSRTHNLNTLPLANTIIDNVSLKPETVQDKPLDVSNLESSRSNALSAIQPGTFVSILTVYSELLTSLHAVLLDLSGAKSASASCVVIVMDSNKPFTTPQVKIQGMNDVVRAIGGGGFVDFTQGFIDQQKQTEQTPKRSHQRKRGKDRKKKDKHNADDHTPFEEENAESSDSDALDETKSRLANKSDPLDSTVGENPSGQLVLPDQNRPRNVFLPERFVPLIQTIKDFFPHMSSLQQLRKEIYQLYWDKMESDRADVIFGRTRPVFQETVLDYYLFQQGLRNLAEIRVIDLIGSVRHYAQFSSRVRVFGRLCGMLTPFHLEDDPNYVPVVLENEVAEAEGSNPVENLMDNEDELQAILRRPRGKGIGAAMRGEEQDSEEDERTQAGEKKKKKKLDLFEEYKQMEGVHHTPYDPVDVEKYRDNADRNKLAVQRMLLLDDTSVYSFDEPWPESAVDFAMNLLSIVLERGTALALPTLSTADEIWTISATRALECVRAAFEGMPSESIQNITNVIQEIGASGVLNVDEMIEYAMLEYMSIFNSVANKMSNILVFTAYKDKMSQPRRRKKKGSNQSNYSAVTTLSLWGSTEGTDEETLNIMKLTSALTTDAVLSYDEFRSLIRIVDPKTEERMIIRMFRNALIKSSSSSISPSAFFCVCRDGGLFGQAAGRLNVVHSIMVHADEENRELQKMAVSLWKASEPFFERRLLEIGARKRNISLEAFGEIRNKIAEVGRIVMGGKTPQKAMREFRQLCVTIAIFGAGGYEKKAVR